jgi:hypothetical protein
MQKKLNVKINKTGQTNAVLLDVIARYNEGKCDFSARDVEGWLTIQKAYLPFTLPDALLVMDSKEGNTYHISEDGGKTFTLTIEWLEIYSLPEVDKEIEEELTPVDDLKNVL